MVFSKILECKRTEEDGKINLLHCPAQSRTSCTRTPSPKKYSFFCKGMLVQWPSDLEWCNRNRLYVLKAQVARQLNVGRSKSIDRRGETRPKQPLRAHADKIPSCLQCNPHSLSSPGLSNKLFFFAVLKNLRKWKLRTDKGNVYNFN